MINPVYPSLDKAIELSKLTQHQNKNLLPLCMDIIADLETPVSAFLKLRQLNQSQHESERTSFLLESVTLGEHISRYSFLGCKAFKTIKTGKGYEYDKDPLVVVEEEMSKYNPILLPEIPLPFTGGAVGYCSFDAVKHFEPKVAPFVDKQQDVLQIPESMYMFFDTIVAFDHAFQTLKIISYCRLDTDNLEAAYASAVKKIEQVYALFKGPLPIASESVAKEPATRQKIDWNKASNVGKEGYMGFVDSLKGNIIEGDIFQAVPSQRMNVPMPEGLESFHLYRQMRAINPSPYMYYLELGDGFEIVGASPEMLVKVDEDRNIETHPIAGTRHRGKTPVEDEALAADLLADEKERAEHTMLVDLGRNDIGRVAEPGTVKVPALMKIEKYSHVMHIVSVVTGRLREDKTVYDAYRAVFPAGTVSGAPKVRAIQLVSSLETERRGVYAGSVGYFGFNGTMNTAIAIRTIVVKGNRVYCQAGGGIVYDSDPLAEYEETMNKLGSALRTIERATLQFGPKART